ncbi:MAG: sigma-70 family RNA polymerase sigma factor [Burkholderiales bacterium]|nr:MAG: sigma-70 family RNA polymerase sigma factor [Burkholderiales bacterium]
MDDPRTDEALMLAYRDGDAAAFETLYGRWRGRLYRYVAHQAPDHADELFQDVWLRVVGARVGYEVTARFSTWLFRIAHNRLMDHHRGRARSVVALHDDPEQDPADDLPASELDEPPVTLERKQMAQRILNALAELPPPQREAFLLAEEGGMGLAEIADATGVGRETAKSRLRYAHARLRHALSGLGADRRERHG